MWGGRFSCPLFLAAGLLLTAVVYGFNYNLMNLGTAVLWVRRDKPLDVI